jgi:N6-adenosine-specific RNA methylase IME4
VTAAPLNKEPQRYRTIVADPPWPMPDSGKWTGRGGNWGAYNGAVTTLPYETMTLDEIEALPVADLAEPDAHLYVWTINRHLPRTYRIVEAWGFRPAQLLTWCKAPMGIGMGGAFTQTTEHVLFCRRGSLPHLCRVDSTWWQWKRGAHSAKPESFLDLVETVSPAPRLEMFARRNRLGWDTFGDESLSHVELTG